MPMGVEDCPDLKIKTDETGPAVKQRKEGR
jgi:hypothetical protein